MKLYSLLFIFVFASGFSFCQSAKLEKQGDENVVIAQKENQKYGLTAIFYGTHYKSDEDKLEYKIIREVVFQDNNSGAEVKYKASGSIPAGNLYFTEIWSPDEEYLVLPVGMFEGFVVFEAKNALKIIKENNSFDTIKVKAENSGWFSHDFEKWEDNSTISFRAGLHGDFFAFKYNLKNKELYCYRLKCEEQDIGINNKGKIKAIKKGDIETIKRY